MPTAYHFAIHKSGDIEVLGAIQLPDDAQAISFGKNIIRDLMREAATAYAGFTLDIIKRERAISSIPFDSLSQI